MPKIKILVADDHAKFLEAMGFLLSNDPRFEVVGLYGDTLSAITGAMENQPDIVLMDINISPLNGFQATARLCQMSPGIRVIAFSLHDEMLFVREMFAVGAKGYLTKSSSSAEVLKAILMVHAGETYICPEITEKSFSIDFNAPFSVLSEGLLCLDGKNMAD